MWNTIVACCCGEILNVHLKLRKVASSQRHASRQPRGAGRGPKSRPRRPKKRGLAPPPFFIDFDLPIHFLEILIDLLDDSLLARSEILQAFVLIKKVVIHKPSLFWIKGEFDALAAKRKRPAAKAGSSDLAKNYKALEADFGCGLYWKE
jgi:hypothetical protein